MPNLIIATSECDALQKLLITILKDGKNEGGYLEINSCLLSIPFKAEEWDKYRNLREEYLRVVGETGIIGWERATRVYTTLENRRSKPSYLARLTSYPDKPIKKTYNLGYVNQLDSIVNDLLKKPGCSCLSFVVLRPADLIDKFRPGYVPCVIAGDFKFRDKLLNLNVMFRTSDALAVGYADIYHLRNIQINMLQRVKALSRNKRLLDSSLGDLNLFFSRTYITRRIKNNSCGYVDGKDVAAKAIRLLGES